MCARGGFFLQDFAAAVLAYAAAASAGEADEDKSRTHPLLSGSVCRDRDSLDFLDVGVEGLPSNSPTESSPRMSSLNRYVVSSGSNSACSRFFRPFHHSFMLLAFPSGAFLVSHSTPALKALNQPAMISNHPTNDFSDRDSRMPMVLAPGRVATKGS